MSGVAVARHLLATNAALIAVVAPSKIKAGVVPINTTLPAISIRQVSGIEYAVIRRGANEAVTDRIQITALALTYPQQKLILNLARKALLGTRGTVNGFYVDSIVPDIEGPDFYNDDPVVYEQSIDYMIIFVR